MATSFKFKRSNDIFDPFGIDIISLRKDNFTARRAAEQRIQVARQNASATVREKKSAQEARKRSAGISQKGQARATAVRLAGSKLASQKIADTRQQASKIRSDSRLAQAGLKAGEAATSSSKLLTEFEAGRTQRLALSKRLGQQASGRIEASFGAAGISSVGAQIESQRQTALKGTIEASQENLRRQQIIGQGRSGVISALATGIGAAGEAAASAISTEGARGAANLSAQTNALASNILGASQAEASTQFGSLFGRSVATDTGFDESRRKFWSVSTF